MQKMTLNSIETLRISICIPKHTKNIKIHYFRTFPKIENPSAAIWQYLYRINSVSDNRVPQHFHFGRKTYFLSFHIFIYFVFIYILVYFVYLSFQSVRNLVNSSTRDACGTEWTWLTIRDDSS